jgi:hypothetical protein
MMKNLLAGLLSIFGIGCAQPLETYEASTNFDLEDVAPFMFALENKHRLGLNVEEIVTFTSETPIDDERKMALMVNYGGQRIDLEYRVFMDDIDAPDIYFFTSSKTLAALIGQLYT